MFIKILFAHCTRKKKSAKKISFGEADFQSLILQTKMLKTATKSEKSVSKFTDLRSKNSDADFNNAEVDFTDES